MPDHPRRGVAARRPAAAPGSTPAPPTLRALADALAALLDVNAFPSGERGGVLRAPPAGDVHPVRRLGVALEPDAGTAAWARDAALDALWLHRPWRLDADALPPHVALLAHHAPFDERLTTGWSPRLARALGLRRLVPFGGDALRPKGMVGALEAPVSASALRRSLVRQYGGRERVAAGDGRVVRRLAVGYGLSPALVAEAVALGADAYLTGAWRAGGGAAAREAGLLVVAAGHARIERWGLRALAGAVARRCPGMVVVRRG